MGALFICPAKLPVASCVLDVFINKGFADPQQYEFGDLRILAYSKQKIKTPNYLEFEGFRMLISGSCFYRGSTYQENIRLILEDFIQEKLEYSELSGTFLILINHDGVNYFITDRAGSQNVFYDESSRVISTSFLAVLASGRNRQLNLSAISELLLTGNLIGPDTIISQISRYERNLSDDLPGMRNADPYMGAEEHPHYAYEEELDRQIEVLRGFFKRRAAMFDDLGVISGLTGGFDSRLLYFLLHEQVANYRIYTTYRRRQTAEQTIARALTGKLGDDLFSPIHTSPCDMTAGQLSELIRSNLYFNDGLIRAHQYWLEEIKSEKYLVKLYGDFHLGLSGVGGEQYRNSEFLSRDKYRFVDWIYYDLIYSKSGSSLISSAQGQQVVFAMKRKIGDLLGLDSTYLRYLDIKRYYNEIWNPSTRTLRNNIENQLKLFCSPFADSKVSWTAYSALKHVRQGFGFERDMINVVCPSLASIRTDYGFALDGQIPWKYQARFLTKTILGLKGYQHFYRKRKALQVSGYSELLNFHPFLIKYVQKVQKLRLPIIVDKLLGSNTLYPLVIELGWFIEEFDEFVQSG